MSRLALVLLAVCGIDEVASGVPFVGTPGIQSEFGLSYLSSAGGLLTATVLLSLVVEPPLLILANRYPRKWFVCGGLLAMSGICVLASLAPAFWVLLVAVACYGSASGIGVGLAQATLMDQHPEQRERMLTRWTLLGAMGDLATPALFAALSWVALGWRAAFAISALGALALALGLLRHPFPDEWTHEDDNPAWPLFEAVRAALQNRALCRWLLAAWLCNLLDEIVVAFGALYLRDQFGADATARSIVLMSFMVGALLGLALLDRLLRHYQPISLLRLCAAGAGIAYLAWIVAPTLLVSTGCFFITGLFASPLYPLVKAQAYRALPEQSGMVNAVGSAFLPLDLITPLFLGFVADRFGLVIALLLLSVQPLVLLWFSLRWRIGSS